MTKVVPWISRKFNSDFPVGLYPNILARVRGNPPRLEDAARGLSHQQLIMKSGGKWSIQENAGHLLDAEDLHWRRLKEYMAGAESLTPAPYQNIEVSHNERPIGQSSALSTHLANAKSNCWPTDLTTLLELLGMRG